MIEDLGRFDVGLPHGTAALALELAGRAAAAAARLTGVAHVVSPTAVLGHVLLPLVVGDLPASSAPRRAPGGGWVHADLIPDDEELFAVLADGASHADAEALAELAQECRLPVTPYRGSSASWSPDPGSAGLASADVFDVDPAAMTVVDMTTMWAGPLCTMLLAEWGARVVTVEPPSRLDGLRGSPAQFAVLDRGKERQPWDLRRESDRLDFEAIVRGADVLVESFTDRVLPNLGYGRAELARLNPRLTTVRIRAFPTTSDEASWVAFGRGVHAASGLGVVDGEPQPVAVAYPDPLGGFIAYATVLEALAVPERGRDVDISLGDAIAPLLARAGEPLVAPREDAVEALRAQTGGAPGTVLNRAA